MRALAAKNVFYSPTFCPSKLFVAVENDFAVHDFVNVPNHSRLLAGIKLEDQDIMARSAVESDDPDVLEAIVEKLKDQNVLAEIALNNKFPNVRYATVKKITDQKLLTTIELKKRESDAREAAGERKEDTKKPVSAETTTGAEWIILVIAAVILLNGYFLWLIFKKQR